MASEDVIDKLDKFSKRYQKFKHSQPKFKNMCIFIENCINNFYELYKKNKNPNISFCEYRKLMLRKLSNHYKVNQFSDNDLENDSTSSDSIWFEFDIYINRRT